MRVRSLSYFLEEALKSILRNGWMSIASVGVVAITLLILGSFMIISYNVNLLQRMLKSRFKLFCILMKRRTKKRGWSWRGTWCRIRI